MQPQLRPLHVTTPAALRRKRRHGVQALAALNRAPLLFRSEYSTQLNAMRLKVLTAREEALKGLLTESSSKLAAFSSPSSPAYKALLEKLVAQGAAKLAGAGALKVRCRQVDLAAVQDAAAKAGKQLSVDTTAFLPPPPDAARPDAASCLGGVVVATADGSVNVCNTLEERLRISYEQNVPQLRIKIFGKSGGHLRA